MTAGAVAWHDVECAAYAADLPLWRELAAAAGGPVLDLGCGTGRVALDLAALGHEVTAVDSDPELIGALAARARARSLRVRTHSLDVRSLALDGTYSLAIAPMQVVQLLGGRGGRVSALSSLRPFMRPGALVAAALADPFEGDPAGHLLPPLPDVREEDGWVLSSRPVAVRDEGEAVAIDRLRESVSPAGEMAGSVVTILLDRVHAAGLEAEGRQAGYLPRAPMRVPEADGYVGSTVVVLEAP